MFLHSFTIQDVRNLNKTTINPHQSFNLFYGVNGSGKTSLLEAIYLLATGRSFRTHQTVPIIRFGEQTCVVNAIQGSYNLPHVQKMAISRSQPQGLKLRLNGEDCSSLSDWVKHLPIQLIDAQSYGILDAEPDFRRQFLDWMMFHVEPSFSNHWHRYKRALQQRNAALKEYKLNRQDHYQIWDMELIESGEQIDQIRKRLLEEWKPLFFALLDKFLNIGKVMIQYKRGWSDSRTLAEALDVHRERDQVLGFTTQGIHRADLEFFVEEAPAKQHLSRGQSKLFVAALLISRAQFFSQKTDRKCVFLVDDLPSELDEEAGCLFMEGLKSVGGQIFITGIESERLLQHLEDASFKLFHVEQGMVKEVQTKK